MNQTTFVEQEYKQRKGSCRRERFLQQMDELLPWDAWISLIEPYYSKGRNGRPVREIRVMLRMYLLQIWFNRVIAKRN